MHSIRCADHWTFLARGTCKYAIINEEEGLVASEAIPSRGGFSRSVRSRYVNCSFVRFSKYLADGVSSSIRFVLQRRFAHRIMERSCKRSLSPGMPVRCYNYKLALLLCGKLFEDGACFPFAGGVETTFLAILRWGKEMGKKS